MADGTYDDDDRVCKIYDNDDFFTVLVQIFLALFALASLWIKRMNETPQRTFKTWSLDISKQGFGACYAHVRHGCREVILLPGLMSDREYAERELLYRSSLLCPGLLAYAYRRIIYDRPPDGV